MIKEMSPIDALLLNSFSYSLNDNAYQFVIPGRTEDDDIVLFDNVIAHFSDNVSSFSISDFSTSIDNLVKLNIIQLKDTSKKVYENQLTVNNRLEQFPEMIEAKKN